MNNKILLVDDDMFQLMIIQKLLKDDGYECRTAISVAQAKEILKEFVPDLIVSDYEMPETNGFDFRKDLLKNESFKDVPFLFLTSFTDSDLVQQGLDLKALDYIPKNIPPAQLLSKINNLMMAVEEHYLRSLIEIKSIAEKLNLRNVPLKAPKLKNFEIKYFNQSYQSHPGGDFIDFVQIDDRYTFVVLGDVMGKKWGAWFFSFSFLSYIRSAVRLCILDGSFSLPEILFKINNVVYTDSFLDDIFSTLSIVLIDDEKKTVKYAGAGDLPLLKYEKATQELIAIKSEGLLLGFFEKGNYYEKDINLDFGDEIYLISDGMIDFELEGKKRSDLNLFKSKLLNINKSGKSSEEIKMMLFDEKTSQIDDCSFIAIKIK